MTTHTQDFYADEIWRGALTPCDDMDTLNRRVVSRIWNEVWNEGALDACDEIFAPDYVGHIPMMEIHGSRNSSRWSARTVSRTPTCI